MAGRGRHLRPAIPRYGRWADTAPPEGDGAFRKSATARRMLDIREVYGEPAALASPRGQRILARLPGVPITEVASHWRIPSLHGNAGSVARWTRIKRETLVLGVRQSLTARPNGRSAEFIAHIPRHVRAQGAKPEPNQCDRGAWVYDVGENGDCSLDALICDNTADLIAAFRALPTAKASFATKFVNPDLVGLDPGGRPRVRFSLMPQDDSRLLDIRTSPVARRISAAADFLDAGYEVHFNLSPVVLRPGRQRDWAELLTHLDDVVPDRVKEQAAAEVIPLTHNEQLHEVNPGWHPRAEDVLWQPAAQETKRSQNGAINVRYELQVKQRAIGRLRDLIASHAPWLRIRYAF